MLLRWTITLCSLFAGLILALSAGPSCSWIKGGADPEQDASSPMTTSPFPVVEIPKPSQVLLPLPGEIATAYNFGEMRSYNGARIFVARFPFADTRLRLDVWKSPSCNTPSGIAGAFGGSVNLLAVSNGGYYHSGYSLYGLMKTDQGFHDSHVEGGGGIGFMLQPSFRLALRYAKDGSAAEGFDRYREAGPILVQQDLVIDRDVCMQRDNQILCSSGFFAGRHPRTGVCFSATEAALIVVDGRSETSSGLTLPDFARFMHEELGCSDGINMDGGGSSALWVKDKGVVNQPSDGGQERCVADGLMIYAQ